jgi:hypothetical protein
MIKKIIVEKKVTDKEINKLKGTFFTDKGFTMYDSSVDIYKDNGELLVMYRKKSIPLKLKKLVIDNLKDVVKYPSNNRGIASGVFDEKKYKEITGNSAKKISQFKGYRIKKNGELGKFKLSMPVFSGVVGWYDYKNPKTKSIKIIETKYMKDNPEKFKNSFPFIQWVSNKYKKLIPKKYKEMKRKANKVKKYVVPNTIFSTVTVNKNFQTAMHKDKKDTGKLGNLVVFHKGNVNGGYMLFPQYKIGIKVQDRDFLIMDVHEYHTNTLIKGSGERYSFVLYLREGIV